MKWYEAMFLFLGYVAFLSFLSCTQEARSAEWRLLEADRLDFTATKFTCNKTPLAPDIPCSHWRGRTAVDFDLVFGGLVEWRNTIHAEGTDSKYETVGWRFEVTLPLGKQVEVLYLHHSQHRLDKEDATHTGPNGDGWTGFPVEDSAGIRLCFLGPCK